MESTSSQSHASRSSEPVPWNREVLERALPAYEIGEVLGRGAHGLVVAAYHRRLRRDVAVKLLVPSLRFDPTMRARFESEARLLAALDHAHIVSIYDFLEVEGAYLLVMERLPGGTVRTRLGPQGVPPHEACAIALAVCGALRHAHGKGVLHRDIKPENLLFSGAGVLKVGDFGIAKVLGDSGAALTRTGLVVGTPAYIAPEQIEGLPAGPHSDVYAAGIVLYELLCGALPFPATADPIEALHQRAHEEPVALHAHAPHVPPEIGEVTARALQPDPGRRFASAKSFADALQEAATRAWGSDWVSASGVVVHGLATVPSQPIVASPAPPAAPEPGAQKEVPTNLPTQPTPLIGRQRELAELSGLLREPGVGIATLTGPGGVGKTRLAMQAGAELLEEFSDGVFLVSLALLADPSLVMPAVAQTLGVAPGLQTLASYLARKKTLLILDNMEQVIPAGHELAELLEQAPGLKLLVTSREPLRLRGERRYPVPPLALPEPGELAGEDALRHGAIELFVERASTVEPSFQLDAHNARTIAAICVRLDGLPLAIELAAARIAFLPAQAILSRLDQRFDLLGGGAVDLPERHQALRATIGWSYDLLEPAEQELFARLGIFAGGFTLDAAEAVCEADFDALAALVRKSLVTRPDDERFDLLESIREFALEQLGPDEDVIRERHADYYLELAEDIYPRRWRREHELAIRLEREHDNFRAALSWLQDRDSKRYAELASAVAWLWRVHSHFAEGREHLHRAMAAGPWDGLLRARLLASAGSLAAWSGDGATAGPLLEQAAPLWESLGERQEAVFTLQDLGWMRFFGGQPEQACATMEQALHHQTAVGDEYLVNRAQVLVLQMLIALGQVDVVERLGREALAVAARLGDRRSVQHTQHFLADCPLIRGDCASAQERYLEALETAIDLGDRHKMAAEVQGLAMAAAGLSNPRRALRLAGGAAAEMDVLGVDVSNLHFWTELLDRYLGIAREQLGPTEAAAAWQEGRQIGFDCVLEQARDVRAE